MCRILCILAGFFGAVLAAILSVSGLTAGLGNVLHAFFWMLIILLCCGVVLLKWPLFSRPAHTGLALLGIYFALCLRISLFDYISGDYTSFLSHWVSSMRGMGAGAALSTPIGDYNMPYLYLLLLISRRPFMISTASKFFPGHRRRCRRSWSCVSCKAFYRKRYRAAFCSAGPPCYAPLHG